MKIGDRIILTEAVIVYDAHGQDMLTAGTEGTVTGTGGGLLTIRTGKGVYDGVPISSARLITEENAA